MALIVRPEQVGDEQEIRDVTNAAFAPMSYSDGSEAPIIDGLRDNGDLTISLVALFGAHIVGHVAFSPVTIGGKSDGWFGLGPISVHPDHQRTGIGSNIINEGILQLKLEGAMRCR